MPSGLKLSSLIGVGWRRLIAIVYSFSKIDKSAIDVNPFTPTDDLIRPNTMDGWVHSVLKGLTCPTAGQINHRLTECKALVNYKC